MKSRSTKLALLSAVLLTTPLLTFAGGQPAKVRELTKAEMQDRTGITRAVQQGKGAGLSLSQPAIRANAFRAQTSAENQVRQDQPAPRSNAGDTAFRK